MSGIIGVSAICARLAQRPEVRRRRSRRASPPTHCCSCRVTVPKQTPLKKGFSNQEPLVPKTNALSMCFLEVFFGCDAVNVVAVHCASGPFFFFTEQTVFSDFDYINLLCPKRLEKVYIPSKCLDRAPHQRPMRCGVTLLRRKLLWFCTLCVTTTRPVGS